MACARKANTLLAGWLVFAVVGCGQSPQQPSGPPPKTVSQASKQWQGMADGFVEDYLHAQPFFAAQAGRHEFDGQLPDLSAHGIKREIARLHDAREQIAAVDSARLEERERFDREYLLSVIDKNLFWLEEARVPFTNPYWYLDDIDPDMYLSRNYAPLEVRMRAYIKYARGIPRMATDIQANLQGPLPKTFVELGVADFGGMADFYSKNVAPVFASVADPDLQKQLADADASAAAAMTNLKNYCIGLRKTATDKFALGPDLFAKMVKQTERVDVPVAQIEAAGRADLDRNTQALKEECAVYLPKGSLAACVAKESANKPKGGTLAAARDMLKDLRKFVEDHDFVSIPGSNEAQVAEAPPYNRTNIAFIQIPGPYDKGVASTYNISPPDPKWPRAEQQGYIPSEARLLFSSVHEVWPGHFLQYLHSNANPNKLEGLWVGYAFSEGWAHYSEELMVEEGLVRGDPEKHIGQILDALLRDVRLLSAIGMHTQGMTVAQSETMFKQRAFQDPGNARQQAARGTYDPAYLNYTLGKLMIRKLRADWLAKGAGPAADAAPGAPTGSPAPAPAVTPGAPTAPGTAAAPGTPADQTRWRAFHDTFLSYGGPPIPLVRREMMGADGSVL